MTATVTIGEGSAFVFVAVDHCTTECIGLHAAKSGSRFEALEPIRHFIRKENVLWVRSFETIEELRLALLEFKRTYNEHWMLERYDYRSPAQVRRDLVGLDAAA